MYRSATTTTEWTNDMVLEFLNQFELEPAIWNPKHEDNRMKRAVSDAWRRIQSNLSWECKVDDLKRKKDSLMAYYRIHLRKIKKAKCSDTNEGEFRTSWYAFEAMNRFLGDVYDCAGVTSSCEETDRGSHSLAMETSECASNDSLSQPRTSDWLDQAEETTPKHTMDSETKPDRAHVNQTMSECEIYAQLLAMKLARLDEDDRLTLMNDIDNIVFQATMRAKRKRKHESSADVDPLYSAHSSDDTQPSSSRRLCRDQGASRYRASHPAQSPDESRTDYDYLLPSTALPQYKSQTVSLLSKSELQPRIINIKKETEKDNHEVILATYDTIHTDED